MEAQSEKGLRPERAPAWIQVIFFFFFFNSNYFLKLCDSVLFDLIFLYFLAAPCSPWGLNSLTRN